MNKESLYFIQGVFFQGLSQVGISYDHTGAIAVINKGIGQLIYQGFIWYDKEVDDFVGEMSDIFGESRILVFEISSEKLEFFKQYLGKNSFIHYTFQKEKNWWTGRYSGEDSGEGESRCIVTEVSLEFLEPSANALREIKKQCSRRKRSKE